MFRQTSDRGAHGIDANSAQVNRGMAWVYRKYAKDHNLFMLEHEAKRHKRGLWADKSPTPPWQWRKSPRYAAITCNFLCLS